MLPNVIGAANDGALPAIAYRVNRYNLPFELGRSLCIVFPINLLIASALFWKKYYKDPAIVNQLKEQLRKSEHAFTLERAHLRMELQIASQSSKKARLKSRPAIEPIVASPEESVQFILRQTRTNRRDAIRRYFNFLAVTLSGLPFESCEGNELCLENFRLGKAWPAVGVTMTGLTRLHSIKSMIQQVAKLGLPGAYIECGVWRGGNSIMARASLILSGLAHRKMYLCDSFEGLPMPRDESLRKDEDYSQLNRYFAVSEDLVLKNFASFGMSDTFADRGVGKVVKGYFNNSLPRLRRELLASADYLAILRMDGDMYDSTADILYHLYDLVVVGGFIVIDDFGWRRTNAAIYESFWGAGNALLDFRALHDIEDECHAMHNIDFSAAWFRKCRNVTVKYEHYLNYKPSRGKSLQPDPPITGAMYNGLLRRWKRLGFHNASADVEVTPP